MDHLDPHLRAIVEAAAALETFDAPALAALCSYAAGDPLDHLLRASLARPAESGWQLDPGLQSAALAALGEQPARLREFYGCAARHYAARLAKAPPTARAGIEPIYMRHLERYCEALIQQEPAALANEAAAAPLELLATPRHRHLLRYYRGLGHGLRDRFELAQNELEALLAEPDLDDAVRARALNSLGLFAQVQSGYERARDAFRASYAIWRRLGNPLRQGLALNNLGIVHYELQEYPAAEALFRESAALFEEIGAAYHQALAFNELGLLCRDQGRWEEALGYLGRAAPIFEREGATDFLGRVANNLGEVELLRGRFAEARAHLVRALEQMATRLYMVDVQLNLGLIHQAEGDDQGALERYQAALELAIELERHDVVALIRYRIGHALQRLGRLDAAGASYGAAIATVEQTRSPIRDEGLLISLMGRWQQIYEAAVLLALDRNDAPAAFDYAERARARAFADMLMRRGMGLASAQAAPISAREACAAVAPGTLLLAYFATGLRGPESALLDAIPPEASGLRACLAAPPRLLLLELSAGELRAHTCPIDPNALQATSPYQIDGRRFFRPQVLRRAHDALLGCVTDRLAQAERVVVAPHGPLHHLPFAALPDSQGRPLLDRVARLAYAPSATVALRLLATPRPAPPSPGLALGYDGGAGHRLRHTEAEATAVAQICGGVAWRGEAGIRQRLLAEAPRHRWLHLACHGEFILDDPLASWLEIGPDERLTAAEVLAGMRLDARLVTLSACRSGVSRVLRGDEPMGLVRAFLGAGAAAVLVTLWPVEDSSARLLMERFYAALLAQGPGADPAAALAVAQRELRDLTVAQLRERLGAWGEEPAVAGIDASAHPYDDPAFWAAYVLVGGVSPASTSI